MKMRLTEHIYLPSFNSIVLIVSEISDETIRVQFFAIWLRNPKNEVKHRSVMHLHITTSLSAVYKQTKKMHCKSLHLKFYSTSTLTVTMKPDRHACWSKIVMCNIYSISILLLSVFTSLSTGYLRAERNYLKPKLERNNIVNKGIWVRAKDKEEIFNGDIGNFIFRSNTFDVDNVPQNNFDAFNQNNIQDNIPFVSTYIERNKRSSKSHTVKRFRKSVRNYTSPTNNNSTEDASIATSKTNFITKLKPGTLFNDYPYEIALLLGNNDRDLYNTQNDTVSDKKVELNTLSKYVKLLIEKTKNFSSSIQNKTKTEDLKIDDNLTKTEDVLQFATHNLTSTFHSTIPKRSMSIGEVPGFNEDSEDINKTYDGYDVNKVDRNNIFNKDNAVWQQTAPMPNLNMYQVVPKVIEPTKQKPVSEKGLVKVLSMLTKSFKKIMKQHDDIKQVHEKMNLLNDGFLKNMNIVSKKFKEFDEKFSALIGLHDKVKLFEDRLNSKSDYFSKKAKELEDNLIEFSTQQKNFLNQQKQFYNVQKTMLAQNEKINAKQNMIAKTQSEISHRQNNFARILKKAKQVYLDNRPVSVEKKVVQSVKEVPKDTTTTASPVTTTTLPPPLPAEGVKIDLFSIPLTTGRLINQDKSILKEKDEQQVDDLVYKYYFNNTFLDTFMKNKILANFLTTSENTAIARNTKTKRDNKGNEDDENTILVPVSNTVDIENDITAKIESNRSKRSIRYKTLMKQKLSRDKPKGIATPANELDKKLIYLKTTGDPSLNINLKISKFENKPNNPFYMMANQFCKQIGQGNNELILKWCIEKALRRLQFLDMKFPVTPPGAKKGIALKSNMKTSSSAPSTTADGATATTVTDSTTEPLSTINSFPDNDELESNLKGYDMTIDRDGNVYYDGSLQPSDVGIKPDSDGFSDLATQFDSGSQPDFDLTPYDIKAKRQALVQRINNNIMKSMTQKKRHLLL